MMSGTSKNRHHNPINNIINNLTFELISPILSFHALTGCDTTSYFSCYSKKSAWKLYLENSMLFK